MKVLKCKNCNHAIIKVWSAEFKMYMTKHKNINHVPHTKCHVLKCDCVRPTQEVKKDANTN